ncbi:hypothetical protein SLE2022_262420 [Rubroshorea leprosula]
MLGKIQYPDADHSFGPHGWRVHQGDRLSFLRKRRQDFVDSVNQFLMCFDSDQNIRKLKVFFNICSGKNSSDLNSWIICASERGVQELDLCSFERKYYGARDDDDYDDSDDLLIHYFYLDDWTTRPLCRLYDFSYHLLFGDGNAREVSSTLRCLRLEQCNLSSENLNFLSYNTLKTLDL